MIGRTIGGRYHITELLGQGGFGTTYLAQDNQSSGNPICVVKHFTPAYTQQAALQIAKRLFDREAKILGKLGTHSQIPTLLDSIQERQDFFIVQEYIEGYDLI